LHHPRENKIEEGKVVGDDISFKRHPQLRRQRYEVHLKGKVAGDEIKFTVTVGEGDRTFDMVARGRSKKNRK